MKKILILLLFTTMSYGQFAKPNGSATEVFTTNGSSVGAVLLSGDQTISGTKSFTPKQKFLGGFSVGNGTNDGSGLDNYIIEQGAGINPKIINYKANSYSNAGGWGVEINQYTRDFLATKLYGDSNTSASLACYAAFKAYTTTQFVGLTTLKGLIFDGTYNELLKSTALTIAFPFTINHSTINPSSYVDFSQISTSGGGWSNYFRFIMKATGASDQRTVLQLYYDGSEAYITADGILNSKKYTLSALNTAPSSATDTGTLGEVRITATYIYVCTATNTWVRTALTTW
jgi:hypothetical protein